MNSYVFSILLLSFLLPNSVGAQIEVYFNMDVDTTLAWPAGNVARGGEDFSRIVAAEIAAARYSVDVALYNLNMSRITDALIAAKDRGVHVRVIGHVENVWNPDSRFMLLADAFVPVASNPKAESGMQQPLMHNKFFVIDARPGAPAAALPVTITGSWNATTAQTYYDPNTLVVIRDSAIAGAYRREFEEMWGSSGDQGDSLAARFGAAKSDNTGHHFSLVDGTEIELHFSPSDGTTGRIGAALSTAQSSIYTAHLTFTSRELADTLQARKNAGTLDIRCIIDNVDDIGSRFPFLGTFAETYDWQRDGLLHHKYGIVDAIPLGTGSEPLVITGSHNWTFSAETINDENLLVIHSERIANQFLQEFAARYREAGGTRTFGEPSSVNAIGGKPLQFALRALPNPSHGMVRFQPSALRGEHAEIVIRNLHGEEIARLPVNSHRLSLIWNAKEIPPGIYAATLEQGTERAWVLIHLLE